MQAGLDYDTLEKAFDEHTFSQAKQWKFSPKPFPLTPDQVETLKAVGQACFEFYKAAETLYSRSKTGKSLLRNQHYQAPWVAEYYDRGKPRELLNHAQTKALQGSTPVIIRPDILITEEGFALTEIDSVPGAVGLTAYLNELYRSPETSPIESNAGMVTSFYEALQALSPNNANPVIAIVVSDESETYRPEFKWLAKQLKAQGKDVHCCHPAALESDNNQLYLNTDGKKKAIAIIYRFFELFDLENIGCAKSIMKAAETGNVVVTPPMKPYQEEKFSLALFHHYALEGFWQEQLTKKSYKLLKKIIPPSWIIDPSPFGPNAILNSPHVKGRPLSRWEELAQASQKDRHYIIKMSGFHELAWGARSVTLGNDSSQTEWKEAIQQAITSSTKTLYILQQYQKPKRLEHTLYNAEKKQKKTPGRIRLSPFYIVKGKETQLVGILATFCPVDKKIIHGMKDAAFIPCR